MSAAPDQNRVLNSADRNHWATPEAIFGWSARHERLHRSTGGAASRRQSKGSFLPFADALAEHDIELRDIVWPGRGYLVSSTIAVLGRDRQLHDLGPRACESERRSSRARAPHLQGPRRSGRRRQQSQNHARLACETASVGDESPRRPYRAQRRRESAPRPAAPWTLASAAARTAQTRRAPRRRPATAAASRPGMRACRRMAPPAVGLILAGVALYMVGAAIHHRPMPFHTPIWHGFVIVGAACHFAAVLEGVVLVPG